MKDRLLGDRLRNGERVAGLFVTSPWPDMIEIAGLAGLDFCILDMEHGSLDPLGVEDLCRAADLAGVTPIVRVRKNDGPQVQRALDIGSGGVQVPQIEGRADAEAAVRFAKYAPRGTRGLSLYTRAARFGTEPGSVALPRLNDEQLVVIHVEGVRGIDNLDAILAVPGIDVVFLGPYDLSQSLGIPGEVRSPEVVQLMTDATARIRAAGKCAGTFADDAAAAARWVEAGVQYLAVGVDVGLYYRACRGLAEAMRGLTVPAS